MVSLGFNYGFLRVHLGLHVGFLIRIFWVSPRVSLGFHLGYKQNRTSKRKRKHKEIVKTGSKEAKEQEVEQQKHVTEEKKK